jgi:hypothetical protein
MLSNCAYIKTKTQTFLVYHQNNSLFCCCPNTTKNQAISSNAHESFSACITTKGLPMLFYRDLDNGAYITSLNSSGKNETRQLVSCAAFSSSQNCKYCQSSALGPCFFYTIPVEGKKHNDLYAADFQAENDTKIETCVPMTNADFYVFNTTVPCVFFRSTQNRLMMCTFLGTSISTQRLFSISTKGDNITDISCLWHNDRLHIAYTINDGTSTYLMYKYFENNSLSMGKVLWTGKKSDGCIIFAAKENIFVFTLADSTAHYAFSENNGTAFYTAARYFKPLEAISKAQYICMEPTGYIAQEIFLGADNKPILAQDFSSQPPAKPMDFTSTEAYLRLRNKVVQYENQLKEKNSQVTEISKTVSTTQQQNSILMYQWRKKFDELKIENENLEQKNSELVNALSKANDDLSTLQNKYAESQTQYQDLENKYNTLNSGTSHMSEENIALKKAKSILEEELYRVNNPELLE